MKYRISIEVFGESSTASGMALESHLEGICNDIKRYADDKQLPGEYDILYDHDWEPRPVDITVITEFYKSG